MSYITDSSWFSPVAIGIGSLVLTTLLVPAAKRVAFRFKIIDAPKAGKMHTSQTPYLGGLAIAASVLFFPLLQTGFDTSTFAVLSAGLIVCLVGLVDDWRLLSPKIRLACEAGAALIAVRAGAEIQAFGNVVDSVLSTVLIVVLMNSFNLLDNMDGLLASIALGIALPLTITGTHLGAPEVAAITAALAGSGIGFLCYNWHPAKIFMGDAGSLFLGLLLVSSVLRLTRVGHAAQNVIVSASTVALVLCVALFDTTLVVISRIRSGRPIMQGGTDHTSHRLYRLGLPIRVVSSFLGIIAFATAATGCAILMGWLQPLVALVPAVGCGVLVLALLLRQPQLEGQKIP